jgi:hypothetical protein
MGRNDKFNERKKVAAYKRELKELEPRFGKKEPLIVLSFKDFDNNQGQSFEEWEVDKILSSAIERLREVCQFTVGQAVQQEMIKIYTKVPFPPESEFKHPRHVPLDVSWACMHIKGKPCVIGYIEENVFYIVFLDKNHDFWITKKKHT